jgi:hypothetical protein
LSAGCLLWLERLQPLFASVMAASVVCQIWLVWQRPPHRRTRSMLIILGASISVSMLMLAAWIALSFRYR